MRPHAVTLTWHTWALPLLGLRHRSITSQCSGSLMFKSLLHLCLYINAEKLTFPATLNDLKEVISFQVLLKLICRVTNPQKASADMAA